MSEQEQFQTVEITLADGRVGLFSGPVLVADNDDAGASLIARVRFTTPQPLPEDYRREMVTLQEDVGG